MMRDYLPLFGMFILALFFMAACAVETREADLTFNQLGPTNLNVAQISRHIAYKPTFKAPEGVDVPMYEAVDRMVHRSLKAAGSKYKLSLVLVDASVYEKVEFRNRLGGYGNLGKSEMFRKYFGQIVMDVELRESGRSLSSEKIVVKRSEILDYYSSDQNKRRVYANMTEKMVTRLHGRIVEHVNTHLKKLP